MGGGDFCIFSMVYALRIPKAHSAFIYAALFIEGGYGVHFNLVYVYFTSGSTCFYLRTDKKKKQVIYAWDAT
jgi:hypothetical protein